MVEKQSLDQVGRDLKLKTGRDQEGAGRPVGAKGRWPDKNKMSKEALKKEAGQTRKMITQLEADLAALKAEKEVKKAEEIPAEMWAVFPSVIYDYLSLRFGDHWKLTEVEVKMYGESISRVANRYLGEIAGEHPEIVGLVIVVVSTSLPRAIKTIVVRTKETEKMEGPKKDEVRPEQAE